MMTLGEYISKYLEEHKLSIRQFARDAGISHTYISYIINGKTSRGKNPVLTIDKYNQLAKCMGITVDELFEEVDTDIVWRKSPDTKNKPTAETVDLNDDEINLIENYRKLSPEWQERIKALLRQD